MINEDIVKKGRMMSYIPTVKIRLFSIDVIDNLAYGDFFVLF